MKKIFLLLSLITTQAYAQTTYFKSYKIPYSESEYMNLGLGFEPKTVENQFKSRTCIKMNAENIISNREVNFNYQSTFTSDDFSLLEYLKASMNSSFEGSFELFNFSASSSLNYEKNFKLQKNEVALIIKAQESGAYEQLADYELKDKYKQMISQNIDGFIEECGTHLLVKQNREAKIFVVVKFSLSDKELSELLEYKLSANADVLDLFKVSGNLNLEKMFEKKIKNMSYSIEVASEGMLNASSTAEIKAEIKANTLGAELINGFINSIKASISEAVSKRENSGVISNYIAVPYQGLNLEYVELSSRAQALMQRNIHVFRKNKQLLLELANLEPQENSTALSEYLQASERVLAYNNEEIKNQRTMCMTGNLEACLFRSNIVKSARAISNAVSDVKIFPTCVYGDDGVLEKYRVNMAHRLYNPEFFFKLDFNYGNSTKSQFINHKKLRVANLVVLGGVQSSFAYINEYLFEEKLKIPGENTELTKELYEKLKTSYNNKKLEIGLYSNILGDNTKINLMEKAYNAQKAEFCAYKKGK